MVDKLISFIYSSISNCNVGPANITACMPGLSYIICFFLPTLLATFKNQIDNSINVSSIQLKFIKKPQQITIFTTIHSSVSQLIIKQNFEKINKYNCQNQALLQVIEVFKIKFISLRLKRQTSPISVKIYELIIQVSNQNFNINNHIIIEQKKRTKMTIILYAIFSILYIINAQNYQVSLQFPFLVTNQHTTILDLQTDLQNNFWVVLADQTVRKYDPTFSNYTVIPYSEKPELIKYYGMQGLPFWLSGGGFFYSSSFFQLIIFNHSTAISFHSTNNYSLLSSYQLNDTIIFTDGNSFQHPTGKITPYLTTICKNSIKFIYQSSIYTIYNYSTFGANLIALSATIFSYNFVQYSNSYNQWNYGFLVALNNSKIYLISVNFTFYFNSTAKVFDLKTLTKNYSIFLTLTQNINSMMSIFNLQIILMQAISGTYYHYDILKRTYGNSSSVSNYRMIQLVEYYNKEYLLTTLGLILVQYSSNLLTLSIQTNLPYNNYFIAFGQYFDLLYAVGGPNVYKANLCLNQSIYQSSSSLCKSYNCSALNCSYCPISNTTCGVCDSGYSRVSDYTCNITPVSPVMNLSNVNHYSSFVMAVLNIDFLQYFISILMTFLKKVIQIPGARATITPIFYLFGNFDDLYLYQFHDRQYNSVMTNFFNELNNLETAKWNIVNFTEVISYFGNINAFNKLTNFQSQYQQFNYTYNNINTNQSQGLLYNSQSYFVLVLPITFTYFWIFNLVFRLLSNYSISKLFRKYYFALFLLIIQMDGNIQQFTFYLARQYISIFAFTIQHKLLKLAIITFGFILILASCTLFYIARLLYLKSGKVLMQLSDSRLLGIFFAVFQFGMRNIILSFLHFFGRFLSEGILIQLLLISQLLFIVFMSLLFYKKIYKQKLKILLIVLLSITRVILIITFMVDFEANSDIIQNIQLILLIMMIVTFSIGILLQIFRSIVFYFIFFVQDKISQKKVVPFSPKNYQLETGKQFVNNDGLKPKIIINISKSKKIPNNRQDLKKTKIKRPLKIQKRMLPKDSKQNSKNIKIIRLH